MEIKKSGSQPSAKGPAEWFTGTVRIDPLIDAPRPARVNGASVTFEPGARTAWHTHPLGQTLIVTSGVGRAQRWGGPIEEIRPGDIVWIPPGEKHWHGAAPTTAMTHMANAAITYGRFQYSRRISENTMKECAAYFNRAYSARACSTIGILGSASFHSVKRSLYALLAFALSPARASALAS